MECYIAPVVCPAKFIDFQIGKVLGQGAFGEVRLIKHKETMKFMALKILKRKQIIEEDVVQHAKNEKRILGAIDNPFLVRLYFVFKNKRHLYIVLEFAQGGDLYNQSIIRNSCFSEHETRFLSGQVLLGLEYMHSCNIVYRDLKPENILLSISGNVKLTDMGFAKRVDLRTYTFCGTPPYIAPEIIAFNGYGKAADWWSFGVFVYVLASGSLPFYHEKDEKLYELIMQGKFEQNPRFSEPLKELIKNLLQGDLSKRWGNLYKGVEDIKKAEFYESINWMGLYNGLIESPIQIPSEKCVEMLTNFKEVELLKEPITEEEQEWGAKFPYLTRQYKYSELSRRANRAFTDVACDPLGEALT
ncbi:hypothetical protein Ciccas_004167 [Cichlidogyrus casuarinus]|uniref:cAMP-dependent protein kinase n=1 Tax=Cichlidogyrus casuarinus TaxID=1844966 RepID=A0ABD2QCB5_9PLAT